MKNLEKLKKYFNITHNNTTVNLLFLFSESLNRTRATSIYVKLC